MIIMLYRMAAKFLALLSTVFPVSYGFKALRESIFKERMEECSGFTLVELLIVIALISTLAAIAVPQYETFIDTAKRTKAIAEIRMLDQAILAYNINKGEFPDTLNDIGKGHLKDPWGHPYEYLNFENVKGVGPMRKDRFLVPLNTDYDLYSKGEDGLSLPPLTAPASHDDIIRANNGDYVGLASLY